MSDIVAFIRQRLDEDERAARVLQDPHVSLQAPGPWSRHMTMTFEGIVDANMHPVIRFMHHADPTVHVVEHVLRYDPARVLREVAAKRAIVDAVMSWEHLTISDCWYSCPLADGCNENETECNCGVGTRQRQILVSLAVVWVDHPDFHGWIL